MISLILLFVSVVSVVTSIPDADVVANFHFHTLFFQWNNDSVAEALILRKHISALINDELRECSITCDTCAVYKRPVEPYPVGSFNTCCNESSVPAALAFFSKNRGSLTVFGHPSTAHPYADHSTRSIWIGPSMPLDLSRFPVKISKALLCKAGEILELL